MSAGRIKIAVTGLQGQVVSALIERAPRDVEIIALGRPQLELSKREAVLASLRHARCDVIINAAAYTQVDRAEEEPEIAMRVNAGGAENVAQAASELGVPLLHLSTDYVFDGLSKIAYQESDPTAPTSSYGRSKLEGEENIKKIHSNHAILRTAWVYSPFGNNFVKTMLRLGAERDQVRVVADQIGNPTSALDIADGLILISRRMIVDPSDTLRGVFHMTGGGEASWADVAEAIFAHAQARGHKQTSVVRITTKDYPTPAARPMNSRLDNSRLNKAYGICLPLWRSSLESCVMRLLAQES